MKMDPEDGSSSEPLTFRVVSVFINNIVTQRVKDLQKMLIFKVHE